MPDLNGIELTNWIKSEYPEIKVLIISMYNDGPMVSEIFQAEAEGYILKNTGKKELFHALDTIADGGTHYSGTVLDQLRVPADSGNLEDDWFDSLTKREREILNLILEELTTDQIAEKLFISSRTVETHRKHIMEKSETKTVVGLMKSIAPMITNGRLDLQKDAELG
jgi:DNA-binding NarL/FixJ family response regulator